jgi:hypothetical protein
MDSRRRDRSAGDCDRRFIFQTWRVTASVINTGHDHPVITRWNDFVCWQSVRFDSDERAIPRGVRLACAAARVGGAVRVTEPRGQERRGVIVEVHSTLVVALPIVTIAADQLRSVACCRRSSTRAWPGTSITTWFFATSGFVMRVLPLTS